MKDKIIKVNSLSVNYNKTKALIDVNLDVLEQEYLGIIGPNGGGKTTLIKAILGLVKISSGKIEILGEAPGKTGKAVGYVPQVVELNKSFPINVLDVVLAAMLESKLRPFKSYRKEEITKAEELLEKVNIHKLRNRQINELSGGEFQKMLIARALAVDPKILVLDEPTASIDAKSKEQVYDLLHVLNKKLTIILVTHDLLAISEHVSTIACINQRLTYHGNEGLNQEVINTLYGYPVDLLVHGVSHRKLKEH